VGWSLLSPFPGTAFYEHEKHKDIDWSGFSTYKNPLIRSKELTNEQLTDEQKRLIEKYSKLDSTKPSQESCRTYLKE